MNIIRGTSEQIIDMTEGQAAEYEETIVAAVDRLIAHADKHRQLVKLVSNADSLCPQEVTPLLVRVLEVHRECYPEVTIIGQLPEGGGIFIASCAENAIAELVDNAVRHSDSETPTVEITATVASEPVEITVADDGPSIPQMNEQHLRRQKNRSFTGAG